MGLSTEQTTAVLDSAAKLVEAARPETANPEPAGWLTPLIVTIVGGIVTSVFGVWYAKRRKKKS
jgi:hypothetical protein